jgi:hypothetical protein
MRRWVTGTAVLAFLCLPGVVLARPEQAARAESLFRAGKAALQRGEYATACPRLAESQRLEPAGGTLLALALCYEGWGRKATAWALFQEAEAMARAQGRKDRADIARRKAAALESQLSFVTIEGELDLPHGVEITLDGQDVGSAALGTPAAVDGGSHQVEARYAGASYYTKTVEVSEGQALVVRIPRPPSQGPAEPTQLTVLPPGQPLVRAVPVTLPGASPTPNRHQPYRIERLLSRGMLGLGLATLLAGGYFGVRAFDENAEVEKGCPRDPCPPVLEPTYRAARRDAALANWLVGAGVVATTLGVVGVFTFVRTEHETQERRVAVRFGGDQANVTLSGAF